MYERLNGRWFVDRRKWDGRWRARDPRCVYYCGPGCRCLTTDTHIKAFIHAQTEATR